MIPKMKPISIPECRFLGILEDFSSGIIFPIGDYITFEYPMNYNTLIARLYFLLVYADGSVNDREIATAQRMIKVEGLNQEEFDVQIKLLAMKDKEALFAESMIGLKQLTFKQQVRIVAWLCVIANADGFMDRGEWQLIYKVYHKELNLPLHDIFAVQKELNMKLWEKSTVIGL